MKAMNLDLHKKCPKCEGSGLVPDAAQIGAVMRTRRLKLGMTMRAIAKKLGCTPTFIYELERGTRTWKDDLLKAYQKIVS